MESSTPFRFIAGLLRESQFFHQSLRLRIVTAEVAIDHGLILHAALLKDFLAESARHLSIEDSLFLEERERVSLKHLRPFVRIVSGRVSPSKDMRE